MGSKKRAFFRVVAADSRSPRDGRFLETLGRYNPITKPAQFTIEEDKVAKWLDDGAQMSDTVRSLCTQIGFVEKYEKAKRGEDVTSMTIRTEITERKKKRKKTKASAEEPVDSAVETSDAPAEAEA
jgi:small subunit ribosomal protein S16